MLKTLLLSTFIGVSGLLSSYVIASNSFICELEDNVNERYKEAIEENLSEHKPKITHNMQYLYEGYRDMWQNCLQDNDNKKEFKGSPFRFQIDISTINNLKNKFLSNGFKEEIVKKTGMIKSLQNLTKSIYSHNFNVSPDEIRNALAAEALNWVIHTHKIGIIGIPHLDNVVESHLLFKYKSKHMKEVSFVTVGSILNVLPDHITSTTMDDYGRLFKFSTAMEAAAKDISL